MPSAEKRVRLSSLYWYYPQRSQVFAKRRHGPFIARALDCQHFRTHNGGFLSALPLSVDSGSVTVLRHKILPLTVLFTGLLAGSNGALAQLDPDRAVGVSLTSAGIGKFAPGHWGLVEMKVANRGETEASPVAVGWLKEDVNLEFSRQLTVPPGSIRKSWIPIFIPDSVSTQSRPGMMPIVELQSNTRVIQDGTESIKRGDSFDRVESFPLRLFQKRCVAFISDGTERQLEILRLLNSLFQERPRESIAPILDPSLPSTIEGYNTADVIIVGGDSVAEDAAAFSAVMEWVLRGGTLWVMLDQVSPATFNQISGDAFSVEPVDRVTLTDFGILAENRAIATPPELRQMEKPADFVRVLADGVAVSHSVDGWPAAFSRKLGQGRIVCTTLAMEGWYVPANWNVQENLKPQDRPYRPSAALTEFLDETCSLDGEKAVSQEAQIASVNARIGVEVPGRNLVLSVLGGFLLVLIATVPVLKRLGRIELAGFAIPLVTLAIVTGLSVIGAASRSEPDRVTQFQFITVEPGQPLAHVEGVAATYSKSPVSGPFVASEGGIFLPERSGTGMGVWRREQQDPPAWAYTKAQIPSGVRMTPYQQAVRLTSPVLAEGTFDENGFVGSIDGGQFGELSDLTIAGRTHFTAAAQVTPSGQIVVRRDDILPPGEFLGGQLLNDEQQRRQAVLQQILTIEGREDWFPQRLMLLGWADPAETGFKIPIEKRTGAALVGIPLQIRRPAAGTAIQIPSLFMTMNAIRGDQGTGFSSSYSNSKGTWTEKLYKGVSTLRFQVPKALLPMEITSAVCRVKISAPQRTVRISAGPPGRRQEITSRDSMVGEFSYTITDKDALALDEVGGLQIVLDIGDVTLPPDESNLNAGEDAMVRDQSWQVHWVQLEVAGTVSGGSSGP
jgi:hypothetical protein